ncbi:MAG TPA: hypothetical protein VF817_02515 [Patescibacteria group bacterium]
MENEDKKAEGKVEEKKAASTTSASPAWSDKKKTCKDKLCAFWDKHKKTVLAVLVLLVLVGGSFAYKYFPKRTDIGPAAAKTKLTDFINKNLLQPGTTADITEIVKENGLYKVTVSVGSQKITAYLTEDGSKFFPQVIDLDAAPKQDNQQAANEKSAPDQKQDVPEVKLFVMSYCPYGLQMEKGLLPAIESLGSKIKFSLEFVDYTLHGQKEVDENTRQYCIQKTQPAKLDSYLKCFWKDASGASDACMKSVGINTAQVSSCVSDTNKQFALTEKDYGINKDDNDKYGVQGSPTLVVNGTTVSSGRDSASVLKAICSGFNNAPKECSAALSSTAPAPGFDSQGAGSGSASSAASCH